MLSPFSQERLGYDGSFRIHGAWWMSPVSAMDRSSKDISSARSLIFPKKGPRFYDITILLKDKTGFAMFIDKLSGRYISHEIDLVSGWKPRGFIFAPALAYRLNTGLVPVRKPGKLRLSA